MRRDPNIPDAFDVYTVVVLRRPAVNGPFDEQSDPSYRRMSIFACDPAEAHGCPMASHPSWRGGSPMT